MLIHQVEVHGTQNVSEELLALICIDHLLTVDWNLLVFTPNLDVASVRSYDFIH